MSRKVVMNVLTPTALPRKKRQTHKTENEWAKDDNSPNKDVKKRVALKAVLRPMRSEPSRMA
jgi:hypothetical protein